MYKWTVTYNFLRPKSNVPYAFIGHLLSVSNMYIPRYNYYLIKCNWHLDQPQCTSTWRDSWCSPFSHSFHQQYFSSKQEGKRRWGLGQATFFWPESGSGWLVFLATECLCLPNKSNYWGLGWGWATQNLAQVGLGYLKPIAVGQILARLSPKRRSKQQQILWLAKVSSFFKVALWENFTLKVKC